MGLGCILASELEWRSSFCGGGASINACAYVRGGEAGLSRMTGDARNPGYVLQASLVHPAVVDSVHCRVLLCKLPFLLFTAACLQA